MKITKYPQSCLLVESKTTRILIDPGSFVAAKYTPNLFGQIDAILLTHEHSDHAHAQLIGTLKVGATKVYANASTKALLGDLVSDVVNDGESFEVGTVKITAHDLPHVALIDGTPGPQNTGYVIDNMLFHPGDGVKIDDVKVLVGAIPIAGPDLSARDAYDLAISIGCKVMIPIHYDYFLESPDVFHEQAEARQAPFKVVSLKEGETYDTDELTAS